MVLGDLDDAFIIQACLVLALVDGGMSLTVFVVLVNSKSPPVPLHCVALPDKVFSAFCWKMFPGSHYVISVAISFTSSIINQFLFTKLFYCHKPVQFPCCSDGIPVCTWFSASGHIKCVQGTQQAFNFILISFFHLNRI